MPSRAQVVAEAREWLGTPYFHLQREKGRATDCIGLVIGIGRKFGFGDYRRRDYSKIPDPVQMESEMLARLDRIPVDEALPGDILWLGFTHPRTRVTVPRHTAILAEYPLGGHSIIHAYAEMNRVVEHRLDDRWRRRIVGAFAFRGIDD